MTKLRGTESARILHRRRDHRNASITAKKGGDRWHSRKGVFGVTNHPAHSLTLSLCSLSAIHKQWRHLFIIRSGRQKRSNSKQLVIQSIFPIEMILNKYFLENPSSEKHSKYPPSTTPNHRFVQHTHTNALHGNRHRDLSVLFGADQIRRSVFR